MIYARLSRKLKSPQFKHNRIIINLINNFKLKSPFNNNSHPINSNLHPMNHKKSLYPVNNPLYPNSYPISNLNNNLLCLFLLPYLNHPYNHKNPKNSSLRKVSNQTVTLIIYCKLLRLIKKVTISQLA